MSSSTIIGKNRTHSIAKESEKEKKKLLIKRIVMCFHPNIPRGRSIHIERTERTTSFIDLLRKERKKEKNENMK